MFMLSIFKQIITSVRLWHPHGFTNAVIHTYRSAVTLDTLGITQMPSKHWGPKESRKGTRERKDSEAKLLPPSQLLAVA